MVARQQGLSKTPTRRSAKASGLVWQWLTLILLLLASAAAPAYAQHRRAKEEKKPSRATAAPKRRQPEKASRPSRTGPVRAREAASAATRTRRSRSDAAPAPRRRSRREPAPASAAETKSKAQLEAEKRANERRAREASRILAQTRERKQASLGQLNALQERISVQRGVIQTISSEVTFLDRDVTRTEQTVEALQLDLADLKQAYARTVYAASKARAADQLMFLFAAESFNQFAMRLRYLRQYGQARRQQAARIVATEQELQDQLHGLTRQRQTKQRLLGSQLAENHSLLSLKTEQDQVVRQLSQQETELQREVAERQAAVARLNDLIAARVREEIARAAREARLAEARRAAADRREAERRRTSTATGDRAERRTSEATREEERGRETPDETPDEPEEEEAESGATSHRRSSEAMALTPESSKLSASFAGNRGRLPWPVSRGFVSQHFGRHPHPVLRHVVVENRGVDIQTAGGEVARAIFDGRVLTVASVPGMNTIVMIQHGEFFTVYAKLRNVSVRTGQRVKLRDPIGTVYTNSEGTTELQFQVWRGSSDLNPESWLGRR